MTFLTLQSELQDRLKAYDITITADLTKLKRWINMGQQYICGKKLWAFMMAEEIVQTVVDYTTGTVATVVSSASITFSATITDSKTNQYIKFSDSNDWYQITAHTAGSASATISPAAINTDATATFTIRKLLYTTTTPLIQILDMKQLVTPSQMTSVSPRRADYFLPLYYSASTVYNYIMSSPNSSGNPQFSFLYSPSTVINIMVHGIKVLTDLSANGDTPLIPVPWQDAILNIAAYYGFQGLDDERAAAELKIGEMRINDMANNYAYDPGRHRVMQPVDVNSANPLQWVVPYNSWPWGT